MKRYIFLGFFFLFIIFGLYLWVNNSSSNKVLSTEDKRKAMANILDREPVLSPKKETTWTTYKGKYVSFSYPTDANIYKNSLSPAVLESFSCGTISPRISLAVQVAPNDSLDDYPAVMLRRSDNNYRETEGELGGSRVAVFSKETDGAEKSGFLEKNGKIYSIVVVGGQIQLVEEYYSKVIGSVSVISQ